MVPDPSLTLVVTKAFLYPVEHPTVQWFLNDGQFLITVTNSGTTATGAVTITDALNPLIENPVATLNPAGGVCSVVAQLLSCSIPTIAAGQTVTVHIGYFLGDGQVAGSFVNCATANSNGKATQGCSTLNYVPGPT